MKISVVNKWDIGGGAARAAFRLANALKCDGHDVTYFVNEKNSQLDWVMVANEFDLFDKEERSQVNIDFNRTVCSNTYFSSTQSLLSKNSLIEMSKADVVNIHWVEKFLSTRAIKSILDLQKPIVWTLHDERPLTGGCHYTAGCKQNVTSECLGCIQLNEPARDIPNSDFNLKMKLLAGTNITFVSPSHWLADQAKKSKIFSDHRIEVIPNSVEVDIFKPHNKKLAREILHLPQDGFIILFGCQDAKEKRKGYDLLIEAMGFFLNDTLIQSRYNNKKPHVLMFGEDGKNQWELNVDRTFLGKISDDAELALIYSAADLFVLPSTEDNLPNTVLESMACGTPCVSFNLGGTSDMVRSGESGFLSAVPNARGFSQMILNAYLNPFLMETMSIKCVDIVRSEFTKEIQVENYIKIFSDILI